MVCSNDQNQQAFFLPEVNIHYREHIIQFKDLVITGAGSGARLRQAEIMWTGICHTTKRMVYKRREFLKSYLTSLNRHHE